MDGKPSDEAVFETLVVVHLDEFVEVDTIQVKNAAQMVSKHKVVSQLHNSLNVIRITFL